MNREFNKEKDIHDGICLALFILCLLCFFILNSRRSYVMSDPLPENITVDGTEEVVPTFDPNHETKTVLPMTSSKVMVSKVTYSTSKKEESVYDCKQDVFAIQKWIETLLTSLQGSSYPDLLSIQNQLEGYQIELSKMNLSYSRVQEMRAEIKELENRISELNRMLLSQVLVHLSSFTIYSSKEYQTEIEQMITYLPDSYPKSEFFMTLHQFDTVYVSSTEEFISAVNSELVLEIHLQKDLDFTDDFRIQTSKKIDGEGHSFGGTNLIISNTTVDFTNLNLLEGTMIRIYSSRVSFSAVHNIYETVQSPSIFGFDSILTGEVTTLIKEDVVYGYLEKYSDTTSVYSLEDFVNALQDPFITNIVLECNFSLTSDIIVSRAIVIDLNGYAIDFETYQIEGDITWMGLESSIPDENIPVEEVDDDDSSFEDLDENREQIETDESISDDISAAIDDSFDSEILLEDEITEI